MTDLTTFEEPLPPWASAYANGEFVFGALLPTRDGRITGNACICAITKGYDGNGLYLCITDAGNETRMNLEELNERFYPPKYIQEDSEILRRLGRVS